MMFPVFTSAYHPLFWLHHTMIDKIFADWQDINAETPLVETGDIRQMVLPPFRDASASEAFRRGDPSPPVETLGWDYKNILCYEYQQSEGGSNFRSSNFKETSKYK